MTREELIKKVALKMDEISSSDDIMIEVGSNDNNPLYEQINGLLNESINDVLTKAPIYRLSDHIETLELAGNCSKEETPDKERQVVVITIPNDFIRIASISDANFLRPIVDLAIEGDEIDKKQRNKFLRAKSSKPVGVLCNGGGGRYIVCYSYSTNVRPMPVVQYISRFDGDLDITSTISMDSYVADIVSWLCAGKVFAAQGDINKSKICDENASALML